MALIECPDCGNKVSDLARACIKCGRPIKAAEPVPTAAPKPAIPPAWQRPSPIVTSQQQSNPKVMTWLIGLIVAAIAVKALVDIDGKRQEGHPGAGGVPAAAVQAKPTIDVDPGALLDSYRKNEVATNDKLRGRTIIMTGFVDAISEMMGPILEIQTGEKYRTVNAHLKDSERQAAARLQKNDSVTIACESAMFLMDMPSLSGCVIR